MRKIITLVLLSAVTLAASACVPPTDPAPLPLPVAGASTR